MLLRRLLVSEIQEEDAGEGADQEDDVKPTVVKVELQLPQDVGHDGAILQRHAHPHQQHARHKVHPLCERGPCFIRSLEPASQDKRESRALTMIWARTSTMTLDDLLLDIA